MIGTASSITAEINRQSSLAQQIATLQTQISTQNRLINPSDDPAAAARIGVIRGEQANATVWSSNLDAAAATASRVDSTLSTTQNSLTRAIELMTNATTGTLSDDDRAAIANELNGIAADISSDQATKDSNGQPLFPTTAPLQIPIGDGQTITATGSQAQVYGGIAGTTGTDVVSIIRAAAAAVTSNNTAGMASGLDDVNLASAHIINMRAAIGVNASRINTAQNTNQDSQTSLKVERSGLEDTDIAATVTQLQSKMLTLQAAQATFAQINKQTLFSLLS
jgi:flagellar hook-associated protein 3 FlgL